MDRLVFGFVETPDGKIQRRKRPVQHLKVQSEEELIPLPLDSPNVDSTPKNSNSSRHVTPLSASTTASRSRPKSASAAASPETSMSTPFSKKGPETDTDAGSSTKKGLGEIRSEIREKMTSQMHAASLAQTVDALKQEIEDLKKRHQEQIKSLEREVMEIKYDSSKSVEQVFLLEQENKSLRENVGIYEKRLQLLYNKSNSILTFFAVFLKAAE